jgi:radical SAM superfamily enzyme YgiQ (UPF0313 family)
MGKGNKRGRVLMMTPNLKGFKVGTNRIQPPLGPMISANVIRQNYDHEVFIHDCALENWERKVSVNSSVEGTIIYGQSDKEIAQTIEEYDPDVIGISVLFSNLSESAHNIAKISKQVRPKVPVVLGGNHVSSAVSDYQYAIDSNNGETNIPKTLEDLEDCNIDYTMTGEVDLEFPKLADALINGSDISVVSGLVMRKHTGNGQSGNGDNLEYVINSSPSYIKNLSDELPQPARDLVNMDGYFKLGMFHSPKSLSKRVLSVMCSRGCPEKCTFCSTPGNWGALVRWRDLEDLMNEITTGVERYDIGEIQFEDDTITARYKELKELCGELEKVGIPWCTPTGTKANYHQPKEGGKYVTGGKQLELYKAMAGSGCYQIVLAGESGNQFVLDNLIKKKLKVENMKIAVDNAKMAGMSTHTLWIIGNPGETYEQMEDTLRIAEEVDSDSYSIAVCCPLPGTPVYRQVMKENLWWEGRGLKDCLFRNSLIKVDGFSSPEEVEEYAGEAAYRLNRKLLEKNPELYKQKYIDTNQSGREFLIHQT